MIDNYEVIKKLIGSIEPVGETHTDNARYENLQEMTRLADALLEDIGDIARHNKDRPEYSMSKAGKFAHGFFVKNGIGDY